MLTDKTFLITGGSSAIGLSFATYLAKLGANLILLAKNEKKLLDAVKSLEKNDTNVRICHFNLANAIADDYHELQLELTTALPQLDGLIHCAGVLEKLTPLEHMPMAQWQQTLQVNLNARFLLTKTCLPLLRKSSKASIAFVVSQLSRTEGLACWGAYQAADTATRVMSETLKQELAHTNIDIKTIELPAINTPLRKKVFPFEDADKLLSPNDLNPYWQQVV